MKQLVLSRRGFIKKAAVTGLVTAVSGSLTGLISCNSAMAAAAPSQENLVGKFGIITDIHHAIKADDINGYACEYYNAALGKVDVFIKQMNSMNMPFIIANGDFNDQPADGSGSPAEMKDACLKYTTEVEAAFSQFNGNRYHVMGNHEMEFCTKEEFASKVVNTGIPAKEGVYYYSFNSGKMHFVVLDAAYKADGTPLGVNTSFSWKDTFIPKQQLAWLKSDLAANNAPTIIFVHQLLEIPPANVEPPHAVSDAAEVRAILEDSQQVVAVLQGHYHHGSFEELNGIHYVNLAANDGYGSDPVIHNQYSVVEVHQTGNGKYQVNLTGYGMQPSYTFPALIKQ
ncbi:alkaline phosphatase [Sporomusaceae bacterium BoRhaA]|uniref:metallophosphoesterase n=1 Tax=Pelorhabdus rhamnosifermentans TaxID=2772457 RepID=UPI001C0608F9|nr:metallophosphoesterase [Pelorhabdus rhamnosifermentans]MBU2700521.1 alkaline phosphatase [Pelorhabdus rhamnosifermentans]